MCKGKIISIVNENILLSIFHNTNEDIRESNEVDINYRLEFHQFYSYLYWENYFLKFFKWFSRSSSSVHSHSHSHSLNDNILVFKAYTLSLLYLRWFIMWRKHKSILANTREYAFKERCSMNHMGNISMNIIKYNYISYEYYLFAMIRL